MTLENYIKECNLTHEKIKIGTVGGTGYFWGGKVSDLNLDELNVSMFAGIAEKLHEYLIKFAFAKTKKSAAIYRGNVNSFMQQLNEFETIKKREVIETRNSIAEKNTAIVIVTGIDGGNLWTVDPLGKVEIKSESAAMALASAIYEDGAESLVNALKTVVREADWFGRDPYGILTDPQGIIKACEIKAGVLKEIKAVVKRPDHRGAYTIIKNGYDGFAEIVGKYVVIDELDGMNEGLAVIYNPVAQNEGKDLNCQVGDTLYYGPLIFVQIDPKTQKFIHATQYPQIIKKADIVFDTENEDE